METNSSRRRFFWKLYNYITNYDFLILSASITAVNLLSGPLAQAGISIFYISTNQSDFVLVPESRLHDAVNSLNKEFAVVIEGLDSIVQGM